jgi:hypothetical protein
MLLRPAAPAVRMSVWEWDIARGSAWTNDAYTGCFARDAGIRGFRPWMGGIPTWRVLPVQSGHDVMVDAPDRVNQSWLGH